MCDILDLVGPRGRWRARRVGVDKLFQADWIMETLSKSGVPTVALTQGMGGMGPPSKKFEELVLGGQVTHDGNPLMAWSLGNVSVQEDHYGNYRPSKKNSQAKIDPVVAAIMAVDQAVRDTAGGNRFKIDWGLDG